MAKNNGAPVVWALSTLVCALIFSGCMSMKGSSWKKTPVMIQSSAQGIDFKVVDGGGKEIASGKTPFQVELHPKALNGKLLLQYTDKDGNARNQVLKGKWNAGVGAMVGNTFLPGFGFGWIIDAATGNLWIMPSTVTMENVHYEPDAPVRFMIANLDEINPEVRQYLIPAGELYTGTDSE